MMNLEKRGVRDYGTFRTQFHSTTNAISETHENLGQDNRILSE
jgi:hypothetical protein